MGEGGSTIVVRQVKSRRKGGSGGGGSMIVLRQVKLVSRCYVRGSKIAGEHALACLCSKREREREQPEVSSHMFESIRYRNTIILRFPLVLNQQERPSVTNQEFRWHKTSA